MVDPVIVCSPPAPDLFLGFSGAAWSAMGSFVSAASVIALVLFNWRYLHWTRKMSESSGAQSTLAQQSLNELRKQLATDLAIQRHAAIAVLHEALNSIEFWTRQIRSAQRLESEPVRLIPEDWNLLTAYVSRHLSDLIRKVRSIETGLRQNELHLNSLLLLPMNVRHPNSDIEVRYSSLISNMQISKSALESLDGEISREVIHTPPT